MNLDELRSVQSKERQKDSLQHLRDSFYADVAAYVADRKAARDDAAAEAEDPFSSPEVRRLTDEIETAEEVAEAIYERRMGKLVKQASLAAAGMSADEEGLTTEERELFTDLVDRIQANKTHVLDVLSGEVDPDDGASEAVDDPVDAAAAADPDPAAPAGTERTADPPDPGADRTPPTAGDEVETPPGESATGESPEAPPSEGVSAADVMGGGDGPPPAEPGEPTSDGGSTDVRETSSTGTPPGASPDPDDTPERDAVAGGREAPASDTADPSPGSAEADAADAGGEDRVTLRITRDVGDILGVDDREYTLEREDVVTLPSQNADPLVERDAAERLE